MGVNFAKTGIPGTPYGPGSSMAKFLGNLNSQVASATRNPDGTSVIAWAEKLEAQAKAKKAAAQKKDDGGGDIFSALTGGLFG
jgi:hypothetical protein